MKEHAALQGRETLAEETPPLLPLEEPLDVSQGLTAVRS